MEREFQLFQSSGGESSTAVDEAYINGVYAGLSFRSLLTYGSSHQVTYDDSFDPASETLNLLKMPKTEPLFTVNDVASADHPPPYNFFAEAESSSNHHHHKLPNLLSLEPPPQRRRQRQQQQRLSDKTRCLQKLLPLDEKMDMARVLEEAYKYIKFLQAQVSVLQSMPCAVNRGLVRSSNVWGGEMNRQQLLEVMVNSRVAQTQLYSKGCCVYSIEQMVLLKKIAERKADLYDV